MGSPLMEKSMGPLADALAASSVLPEAPAAMGWSRRPKYPACSRTSPCTPTPRGPRSSVGSSSRTAWSSSRLLEWRFQSQVRACQRAVAEGSADGFAHTLAAVIPDVHAAEAAFARGEFVYSGGGTDGSRTGTSKVGLPPRGHGSSSSGKGRFRDHTLAGHRQALRAGRGLPPTAARRRGRCAAAGSLGTEPGSAHQALAAPRLSAHMWLPAWESIRIEEVYR